MRLPLLFSIVVLTASHGAAQDASPFSREQIEFFESRVRPLLIERCQKCHGPTAQKGNLRLDSRAAVLRGGDTGPAIILEHPEASELLRAISYDPDGYQMPPDGKLSEAEIAVLKQWVAFGAPWPAEMDSGGQAGDSWAEEFDRRMQHWSFQPLARPSIPRVSDATWCRNPVDRFVAARREVAGLHHADEADRRTWLRRVTFDVLGLPPTPEEVDAFGRDDRPDAHEQAIDRLLASPHFGERWGRHWLDLVRYAESRGHEFDYDVANPWPYRDYVLRALNADVPYDQFVMEHVAGDLLQTPQESSLQGRESRATKASGQALDSARTPLCLARLDPATGANESIVATGFWFLGEWVHSPVDIRQEEAERFANMIDVYSKTFLGLTVACARCHDHKFDPIPQTDFYALQGYLQSSAYAQVPFESLAHNRTIAAQLDALEREAATSLLPVLAELARPTLDLLDQYLLTAHSLLREAADGTQSAGDRLKVQERIETEATTRALDPHVLRAWVAQLTTAADNPREPFHHWAQLALGRLPDAATAAAKLAAAIEPEANRLRREAWYSAALNDGRQLDMAAFRSDGCAYRTVGFLKPAVRLTADARQPLSRLDVGALLEYRPEVGELALAPTAAQEPGRLSELQRGGRTLLSPSFEITQNRVCCLVRGSCDTYVVVDSHALINGPLHGSLLQKHAAPEQRPGEWRWIEHDVSRYRGHRAHLELMPHRGEDFAVRQVVLAGGLPPAEPPNSALLPVLASPAPVTLEQLAVCYRDHWRQIPVQIDALLAPSRTITGQLDTAEWACRHPDLFGLDTPAARERFAAAAAPLIAQRTRLISQLQAGSALAPVMLDCSGEDEYLFIRGNWKKRGETVPRRFLSAFNEFKPAAGSGGSTECEPRSMFGPPGSTLSASGRLELALQMIDPQQTPIVARVVVNRIWQHYFGRGIVPTPDDLGHLGLPPSHPELLDWLACELVEHDWSLKHVHRLILSSATYRMAADLNAGSRLLTAPASALDTRPVTLNSQLDPGNTLLWRMNVQRLEGEIVRDAILALSGRLDDTLYGPSVPVHLTPFMEGRGRPGTSGPVDGRGRRSLYIAVRRNFPDPLLQAFDFPNPHTTIGRRNVSNVPAQALALLNNPLVLEQSAVAARRILDEDAHAAAEERMARLYVQAFGRQPSPQEVAAGQAFLQAQATDRQLAVDDPRVWADYVHVLINAKEFLFVR